MNKLNTYDKTIGYASINEVDRESLERKIKVILESVKKYCPITKLDNILMAGCGDGTEAMIMSKMLDSRVIGVDISLQHKTMRLAEKCVVQWGDVSKLEFEDSTFSFIYSYHVLEHVSNPSIVLQELARVMQQGAILFIGFPNRHRIFAYFGDHNNASWNQFFAWNLKDYQMRIRGKFHNKFGAHAGFTEKEFIGIASEHFDTIHRVRKEYMHAKYHRFGSLINMLHRLGLDELAFPSNYFICIK